ncbi:hypothetical protein phD2B_0047 [Lelliottia phage phD2B]|uniref:Uncharacterized protein n=1 Tax=Lelliottia phage phD2B TaxID=1542498 RepID=A0A088FS51_9CAUD|nr:hypothetical protein phD2B_0047 [Lelliottia phage phD2B]AIM51273.1 hypothetical protein phD2B_0047 [Lelliottia phage phD2B]
MAILKSKKVIGAIIGLGATIIGASIGVDVGAIVAPLTEVVAGVVQ